MYGRYCEALGADTRCCSGLTILPLCSITSQVFRSLTTSFLWWTSRKVCGCVRARVHMMGVRYTGEFQFPLPNKQHHNTHVQTTMIDSHCTPTCAHTSAPYLQACTLRPQSAWWWAQHHHIFTYTRSCTRTRAHTHTCTHTLAPLTYKLNRRGLGGG